MNKIYFITSNKGKIESLQKQFIDNDLIIEIEGVGLDIVEPQASNVKEVSEIKARKAFSILKKPLIVEDGGFEIEALNKFPGVYTKYILSTIGIDGILKLMKDEKNRSCKFVSCTTFVNEEGKLFQFERFGGEGILLTEKSNTNSSLAWSDIWKVFYVKQIDKVLCEASKEELFSWWNDESQKSSLSIFIEWLKNRNNNFS
jgi:non-canonical purine NTP pyrophosphatase (RdgB/HAM1 family)